MSNRLTLATCQACDGNGEIVFAIRVYEPGCGYGHESSDGRPCEECGGTGKVNLPPRSWRKPTQPIISDDDLQF